MSNARGSLINHTDDRWSPEQIIFLTALEEALRRVGLTPEHDYFLSTYGQGMPEGLSLTLTFSHHHAGVAVLLAEKAKQALGREKMRRVIHNGIFVYLHFP